MDKNTTPVRAPIISLDDATDFVNDAINNGELDVAGLGITSLSHVANALFNLACDWRSGHLAASLSDAKSDELAALIRDHAADIGELRESHSAQVSVLNQRAQLAESSLINERKTTNDLRAQLFDALLNAERMRGYMDATEDAKPPETVQVAKQRRFGRLVERDEDGGCYDSQAFGRRPTVAKRWFES